jgi:hypothetical protein
MDVPEAEHQYDRVIVRKFPERDQDAALSLVKLLQVAVAPAHTTYFGTERVPLKPRQRRRSSRSAFSRT